MSTKYWREISLKACEKARVYFSPALAEEMKDFNPEVGTGEHLGEYLAEKVIFYLLFHRDRKLNDVSLLLFVASS